MADQKEYANCILALNRRLMGDDSGVMEVDFRRAIKRINGGRPFRYCPLSKGDSFTVGSSVFNVLWPPPKVTLDGGANGVSRAIQLFHEALQVDERLKQAYEQITSSDFHNPYLIQEEEEACGQVEPIEHGAVMKPVHNAHERLPLKLKAANEALRSAANKMSLCFIEDNRFLFMGDLTKAEIPLLVQELKVLGRTHFSVLITPHHGTHWHNSLNNLHCRWALSSVGPKLVGKTWPDFRNIAHEHLVTHFTGHICLSATARRMCHPGESWSCGREW